MMYWHRVCALVGSVLLIYIALTGALTELADMSALLSHAPATDPNILMMRQHIDGPPNYSVVSAPDYTAKDLPTSLNMQAAMARAATLGHEVMPVATLRMVELRMIGDRVVAHVRMDQTHLLFDLSTGRRLPDAELPPAPPGLHMVSLRSSFKYLHRFNYLGQWATGLNGLAGIGFTLLIVTGLFQYVRLYLARRRLERHAAFWWTGHVWRDLHRVFAVGCGLVLIWITLTGLALSVDNLGAFVRGALHTAQRPAIDGFAGDLSSPMRDKDLARMTQVTLSAFRRAHPFTGLKVLQLRHFVGYEQGVVVADDKQTSQLVFNARSGRSMSMSEAGYPDLGFPFGWEWHQRLKRMHRGDYFGMPGRWLDTLGALAMVYLSISGVVMYLQLWRRRQRNGKPSLLWK